MVEATVLTYMNQIYVKSSAQCFSIYTEARGLYTEARGEKAGQNSSKYA